MCVCLCDKQGEKRGSRSETEAERWMPGRVMREGRSRRGMKEVEASKGGKKGDWEEKQNMEGSQKKDVEACFSSCHSFLFQLMFHFLLQHFNVE